MERGSAPGGASGGSVPGTDWAGVLAPRHVAEPRGTSRTYCTPFALCQGPRHRWSRRAAAARSGGRRVRADAPSSGVVPAVAPLTTS